ncbi:Retrovirus-related Pol polyprotein from transposon RE1 [Vitis vinifera]|uniref:Retrovirus-related Pol polyprotein from transposon RE1 n=1 Tax=Vitis vinifera TaxID=29760 RepID=A0A438HTL4_VITVI|nr:Retrovirus-related Pol polyprotein from transposon RE1 [Vitis vinifera]
MDEEVQALQHNRTWVLVPRPAHTNIVDSKWVLGLDYTNTFNPVIKATTVRVVLSLAVTNRWPLRQLDVKKTFLNDTLTENVYMEQPPGYIDSRYPNHVFVHTPLFLSFISSLTLFISSCMLIDIIITGNNSSLLDSFARKLNSSLPPRIWALSATFLLLDSKPIHTPMIVSHHLTSDSPAFSDPTLYRSLIGHTSLWSYFRPSVAPGALVAYSDADWAGCPDTRRSTSGYSIILAIIWFLGVLKIELLWLTHLLHDLKVSISPKPILLCDNKSAIFLSSNPVSHKWAKHVVDLFTKSVSRPLFDFFCTKLHVCSNPTLNLRGGVKDTDTLP